LRTVLVEMSKDCRQVTACPRRVANSHKP
jgi:hypothetical protein